MKTGFVKSSLKLFVLSAALLAASAARAKAPKGWDVENDRPRLGEAAMTIHYGEPQHADYDVGPAAEISVDEYVAGAGSGEPQVDDAGLRPDSKTFVEKIFSDP